MTLRLVLGLAAIASSALAQTPDPVLQADVQGQTMFRVNVDGGLLGGGTYDGDASGIGIPIEGAGTRLMWYPRKAAFRAGMVSGTQWDAANIGDASVAIGSDVRASAAYATAFGYRTTAAQVSSFAVGDGSVASGAASVAMGYGAHTNARQGSFVFADRSTAYDPLTGDGYFRAGVNHSANWRVSGGFRIFTASNLSTGVTIQSGASVSNWGQASAVISTSTGAYLTTGGAWTNASDRRRKHDIVPIDGERVLDGLRRLPLATWSYNAEGDSVRHLGPMAQDFYATFGLGRDSTSIGTVDADGVALAAAKALDARTEALAVEGAMRDAELEATRAVVARQANELRTLRAELAALRAARDEDALARAALAQRLARLEALITASQKP